MAKEGYWRRFKLGQICRFLRLREHCPHHGNTADNITAAPLITIDQTICTSERDIHSARISWPEILCGKASHVCMLPGSGATFDCTHARKSGAGSWMSEGECGVGIGKAGQLVRERSEGLKSLLQTKAGTFTPPQLCTGYFFKKMDFV